MVYKYFFAKSQYYLLLINQKENEAKFIHDLLKSQNLLDELYLELINHDYNERERIYGLQKQN